MRGDQELREPIEEPLAQLERELMTAYVAGAGENSHLMAPWVTLLHISALSQV